MNNNLERSLGRVEGKIDSLIIDIKTLRDNYERKVSALERRVATLEKKQYTIIIIASAFFSFSFAILKKFIGY